MSDYILIISNTIVGERMAGPGIRYFYLAQVLSKEFPVILALPEQSSPGENMQFNVVFYNTNDPKQLVPYIRCSRAILVPMVMVSWLLQTEVHLPPLIVDGYDPWNIEALFLPNADEADVQKRVTEACLYGDFFLCASERQRDWWLGLLSAMGRVNSHTVNEDPSLRQLVSIVPFGLPENRPQRFKPIIKGIWPGISREDKIILWGGGLWRWLDPITAIKAMKIVYQHHQNVRLVFLNLRSTPLEGFPTFDQEALLIAQELGILGRAVFFREWIPYQDWPAVLLESDVALSLHLNTIEARLAFRSSVIDYVWAGVPIVATYGDVTAELVERYGLGKLVDYKDEMGVAKAIQEILETPKEVWADRFNQVRQQLTWTEASRPLVHFCRAPRYASDKMKEGIIGNAFYQERISQLQREAEQLRELIRGYESGRFIRLMRWLREFYSGLQRRAPFCSRRVTDPPDTGHKPALSNGNRYR